MVFLVVTEETITEGHGNFRKAAILSTYFDKCETTYPAFTSKEAAESFIKKVAPNSYHKIISLPILTNG